MREWTAQNCNETHAPTGNREKVNYGGEYVPENFWKDMGRIYPLHFMKEDKSYQHEGMGKIELNVGDLAGRIRALQARTVLEVGCGFGRCLPFVSSYCNEIERLVGLEFSETMIHQSISYLANPAYKDKIQVVQGDARAIPFKDNEFELIYTHVCLTHIPPEFIPRVTSEISRVAEKYIVHVERFNYPYEHPNPHRWSHMLVPFYLDLGWYVYEYDSAGEFPEHQTKVLVLKRR